MTELRKALYRYDEVAELLSVSKRTVQREAEEGKFDVVIVRGRPRVTAESIRRYVREKVQESLASASYR